MYIIIDIFLILPFVRFSKIKTYPRKNYERKLSPLHRRRPCTDPWMENINCLQNFRLLYIIDDCVLCSDPAPLLTSRWWYRSRRHVINSKHNTIVGFIFFYSCSGGFLTCVFTYFVAKKCPDDFTRKNTSCKSDADNKKRKRKKRAFIVIKTCHFYYSPAFHKLSQTQRWRCFKIEYPISKIIFFFVSVSPFDIFF